jgi:cell division septation protein DedD
LSRQHYTISKKEKRIEMKQEIKERIVGAIIFVISISILVPPILDGHNSENKSNEVLVSSNQFNEKERKVIEIDLRERGLPSNVISNKKNTYIDRFKEYISTFVNNEIIEEKKIQDSNIIEHESARVIFDEFEDSSWIIQVGSFMELENARNQIANLRDIGINAYVIEDISNNQSSYKVRTGVNLSEKKVKEISEFLENYGYKTQILPYN